MASTQQSSWFKSILIGILILNILDAAFTSGWIHYRLTEEANPLMAYLLEYGIFHFIFVKMLLALLGCLLLWRLKGNWMAFIGSLLCGLVYIVILICHLTMLTMLVTR